MTTTKSSKACTDVEMLPRRLRMDFGGLFGRAMAGKYRGPVAFRI